MMATDTSGNTDLHLAASNSRYDIGMDINQNVKEHADAFYNTIRLGNVEPLETLIKQKDLDNGSKSQNLEIILAKTYEELKLKNVPVSYEMEFAITDKLVNLRFFTEKNDQSIEEVKVSLDDVKQRIEMNHEYIHDLRAKYSGQEEEKVDAEFILTARFIAQNIHILKRQLKTTYNKIPWEEIEFCVVNFMSSILKPQEADVIYKFVLDKERLLNHLGNFAEKLNNEKANLRKKDVTSKGKLSGRSGITETISSNNPEFKDLYSDYELIRDVYSLKRIESSIKLASSIDLNKQANEQEVLGKLVIERTLQIIGENLKNTPESPNVSNDIHRFLLSSAPRGLIEIITALRNSLSHSYTLTRKIEFENNKDLKFFQTVQNDLKKIEKEIGYVLYKRKITAIRVFLEKIIKSDNLTKVKDLIASSYIAKLEEIDLSDNHSQEFDRTKELIDELKQEINCLTAKQQRWFNEIDEIISSQETRLSREKFDYMDNLRVINNMFDRINYINNLATIKSMCRTFLPYVRPSQVKDDNFKQIVSLVLQIQHSIDNMKSSEQNIDVIKIQELVYQIFITIEFEAGRIKGIDEFKSILEKKEIGDQSDNERRIQSIFIKIKDKIELAQDKSILQEALDNKKQIHKAKSELISFFDKKLLIDKNSYNKLIKTLKLKAKNEKNLESYYDSNNSNDFKKGKELIQKIDDNYDNFLKKIENLNFSSEKYIDILNEFFTSLKLTKIKAKLEEAINNLVQEYQLQIKSYYNQRLKILKQFIQPDSDKIQLIKNKKLQAAIEMLVLDLTEILENAALFRDNKLFIDEYSPVLIGKALRNYLAHGSALIDTLPFNPSIAITSNAARIIHEEADLIVKQTMLIGQRVVINYSDLNNRYSQSLNFVINQHKMFVAAQEGDLQKVKSYIEQGAEVKAKDINGWTGLHFAAQSNNVEMLRYFMQQGLNIDTSHLYGQTLLEIAIKFKSNDIFKYIIENYSNNKTMYTPTLLLIAAQDGNKEVVELLLEKGAGIDPTTKDENKTPLHFAAQNGHKEVVEVLLKKKANIDAVSKYDKTALDFAAANGHKEVVEVLLENKTMVDITNTVTKILYVVAGLGHKDVAEVLLKNGADVNSVNKADNNATPLHFAAQSGHKEVVEVLLEYKATIDAATKDDNKTPLHFAAQNGHKEVVVVLLKNKAKIDAKENDGRTALHRAARNGHKEVVEVLLENKAKIEAKDHDGVTALHHAAFNGHKEVVEVLLENKANVNAVANFGGTALHYAAQNGQTDVVKFLLENKAVMIDAKNNEGGTALHYAAHKGHKEVVKVLLGKKANVDAVTNRGGTALHYTAQNGHKDIVKILLENKAKVDAKVNDDLTALHYATQNGHKEIVKILLENKANIDATTKYENKTPLHFAAQNDHKEVAEVLLENKAYVDAVDNYGGTALHYAAKNGYKDVVKILLEKRAKVDAKVNDGRTALHHAAHNGHKEVVEILLENEAKIDAKNNDGVTALHSAAQNGHKDVVKVLLDNKAKVDAKVNVGGTALHYAAQNGHKEVVEVLLDNKAKVDAKVNAGETALHYAAENGYKEVVEVLLKYKANIDAATEENKTPLHIAAQNVHKKVVEVLLENKANVDAIANDGATALHYAAQNGDKEIVEVLLVNKANVDAVTNRGGTALHFAAQNGHTEVVKVLLENEAKVDAKVNAGGTALHYAAQHGHKEVVEVLLKFNANIDAATEDENKTPLHFAAQNGRKEIVEILLENDANVYAVANHGGTALHHAAQNGHMDVVEILACRCRL